MRQDISRHLSSILAKSVEFAWTMQEGTEIGVELVKPDQLGIPPVLAENFSMGGQSRLEPT